jgi:hypothetical protein
MRNLARVLRQHAFHLLLLSVALIMFVKPMLLTSGDEGPGQVVLELFVPWAVVIVVLFFVGRSDDTPDPEAQSGEPERD